MNTPAILSALFGRVARPRFDLKVMARIALRSPIPVSPADATRGVGRFLYGDARLQHSLAVLSLAPGPGPGGRGSWGRNPATTTGRHRALRAAYF